MNALFFPSLHFFFVFFLEILVHVRVKKPKIQWELLSPTQNTAPEVPRQ